MRVTLVLSLALNLVVAGIAVGWLVRQSELREVGRFNARVLSLLPSDARAEARQVLVTAAERSRGEVADARAAAERAVVAALRAEPFDEAAYREALEEAQQALAARLESRIDRMQRLGEALGPEERRALADGIERVAERRRARASAD